ncbi:glycosyltransferase [Uliginosibacterium sediminicola]|uniref:Glycosyltransferase n=1 Tax=Uliginosibacterium sediminicola TaxID=2024550 RepID=A0ABU9Z3H7_9RHOO
MDDSGCFKVACVIPTYNGSSELLRLFDSLDRQIAVFDVIVIDSSSADGSAELARERADLVTVIASSEFNHGGTRQRVVDDNPGFDVYVFLTQDAYLDDPYAIANLLKHFSDSEVGAVCGRQLPHLDATPLAMHARVFNYPQYDQMKSFSDVSTMGIKAAFMSNSFSAYRRDALIQVGGFPKHVIFAEDMYVAAKMLMGGWKIAYSGSAHCRHSHNYTVEDEFRRYFDMGVFHARESWIRSNFGGAGGEGVAYVKSELKYLGLRRCVLWPAALFRNAVKLFAYKIGQKEACIPKWIKRKIGMYRRYWDGPFA